MIVTFGDHSLDLDRCTLTGPDGPIHMEPQVYGVLCALVADRHRVVTKNELLDRVWESRFVSESALTSRIKALRSALGDNGRDQHTIRTVHGRGYQFVADVVESEPAAATAPAAPAAPAGSTATRSIPRVWAPLRGRTTELAELRTLMADRPLVTVLGPGGTGKTRLCLEIAHDLPDAEAVAFVDLASVRGEAAVGLALSSALGIDAGAHDDVIAACCSFLQATPFHLVVDNCEHLPAAAAAMVDRLLDEAPTSTVLATSRIPLGLRDEALYRLRPLPVVVGDADPAVVDSNPAVALFCDRVRRIHHDFEIDDGNVDAVIALCRALDGLPLALELAAARTATFGVEDLVARLDRRLDLLGHDHPGAHERHRSLRATLEWSYELLDEDGRRLFRHMAAFPAGMHLDAIEWLGARLVLGADALVVLDSLVAASLVNRVDAAEGARYEMLETMRTFGLDRLLADDGTAMALDLAADWALHFVRDAEAGAASPAEAVWDRRIRREIPNIREARGHLHATGRHGDLLTISVALDGWAQLRDVSEMWAWTDELTELGTFEGDDAHRVDALASQAGWRRGRSQETLALGRRIVESATATWALSRGWSAIGVANLFLGDPATAAEAWLKGHAIDENRIDHAAAGICLAYLGEIERARELATEVRHAAEASGRPSAVAWAEYASGEIEAVAGSPDARGWLESAVARAEAAGTTFTVGVASLTLCTSAAKADDPADTARRLGELIGLWLRTGTWAQLWTTLRHAARVIAASDPGGALQILDKATADPLATGLDDTARADEESLRADLEAELGRGEVDRLRDDAALLDRAVIAERARESLGRLASPASSSSRTAGARARDQRGG